MIKNINLTITLVLISLTVSYAQSGTDTTVCYTQSELVKIANKMTRADELDTLLFISEQQNSLLKGKAYALQMAVNAKQKEVDAQKSIVVTKEEIIEGKDVEITGLREVLKKDKRKLRWTRIGWLSTSGILGYLILSK